jgi:hypothetical protein
VNEGPWWAIHNDEILKMLYRVRDGEDPDMVLMQEYANSQSEYPEDDG